MDNLEEMNEIFEWLGKEIENLPFTDQLQIAVATNEFVEKIKPIYIKNNAFKEGAKFIFKL